MWIWITGIVVYLAFMLLTFALCNAAKRGKSDLPDVEPQPNAAPDAEPRVATTGEAVPETPQPATEPAETVPVDR
jgi:hypothetical protein